MKLTEERGITQNVKDALAKFVCLLYCPKGIHVTSIPDPRRYVLQTSGTKQQSASYSWFPWAALQLFTFLVCEN